MTSMPSGPFHRRGYESTCGHYYETEGWMTDPLSFDDLIVDDLILEDRANQVAMGNHDSCRKRIR